MFTARTADLLREVHQAVDWMALVAPRFLAGEAPDLEGAPRLVSHPEEIAQRVRDLHLSLLGETTPPRSVTSVAAPTLGDPQGRLVSVDLGDLYHLPPGTEERTLYIDSYPVESIGVYLPQMAAKFLGQEVSLHRGRYQMVLRSKVDGVPTEVEVIVDPRSRERAPLTKCLSLESRTLGGPSKAPGTSKVPGTLEVPGGQSVDVS